jgi:hypothetical protein
MCFSATANFVGSGILATVGVITLTKVRHRRELLFAALPTLFAIHQFIEGFVWLGLDGYLKPSVTHDMGAAFVLYAQGLLPFLLPLSVLLFEPTARARNRMWPFLILGAGTTLYMVWGLIAYSHQHHHPRHPLRHRHLRLALLFQGQGHGPLRLRQPHHPASRDGGKALRLHKPLVRLRGHSQRDYPRLLLEVRRHPPLQIRPGDLKLKL